MIKYILFLALVLMTFWFAFEVGRWWKETEDDIRIWPEGIRKNKDE